METLKIYRININTWKLVADGEDTPFAIANLYNGGVTNDLFYITTINGTELVNNQYWAHVEYIDEYGSNSFIPTSAEDLVVRLQEEGFFFVGGSGGLGGATAFTQLTDTFTNYSGRNGQILYVDGMGIKTRESADVNMVQDTTNYNGGFFAPASYFTTSVATNPDGSAYSWGTSPIGQVINTPIAVDEFRVVKKGDGNTEPFFKEVGDYCEGVYSGDGKNYILVYEGGNVNEFASYRVIGWEK